MWGKFQMLKSSSVNVRVGLAVAVIFGTVGWLALTGYDSGKSYYVTIAELSGMGTKAYKNNLRIEGFVQPDSIVRNGPHATFILNEFESHSPKAGTGRVLKIVYRGLEPPPDTFKADAQALAEGKYGRDGVFYASELQAKCASKYEPAQQNHPEAPSSRASTGATRADGSTPPPHFANHPPHG